MLTARAATLEQTATDAARERDALAVRLKEIKADAEATTGAAAEEVKGMEARLQVLPAQLCAAFATTAVFFVGWEF